jgi:energy-coupling factor transporter ATP-binding protein EcfA2
MTQKHDTKLETLLAQSTTPIGIINALKKSNGSKFYRCAFQVNPFDYGQRHAKNTGYENEDEYNNAMVKACIENDIKIVAITDHFKFDSSITLAESFRANGITVFPGFEANSSEGVHILCLFSPETTVSDMNNLIGACDIPNLKTLSPLSNKTCEQLLKLVQDRGGIAITAHVTSNAGLLKRLSGTTRVNAWKSVYHLAAAIPASIKDVPDDYLQICNNKDPEYKRDRPIAFVNAADVSKPDDFQKTSSTCLVKMTDVSIEGLKQAFLDSEGRIQLNSDETPTDYTRLVAVSWDRGLMSEQSISLNAGLNVLIGGRGAGKSTIVESLRYAFSIEPKGKEASNTHKAMMKELMGQKASVAVLLYSPKPSPGYYLVERIYGQEPRVKNENGEIIHDIKPLDLVPEIEVYGQHEISELTRDKCKLADILKRFVGDDDHIAVNIDSIRSRLTASRSSIVVNRQRIKELDEELAALPALREKLKRFKETKLKNHAEEKTAVQAEERLLENVSNTIAELLEISEELLPTTETTELILPAEADQKIPHRKTLEPLQKIVEEVDDAWRAASNTLAAAHTKASENLAKIKREWNPLKEAANERFEDVKTQLRADGLDPDEYVDLDDQVARLNPKQGEKQSLMEKLDSLRLQRQAIIDEWEKVDALAYTELEKAAKKVTKKLEGTVKAVVQASSTIDPLEKVLRSHIDGNLSHAIGKLKEQETLSLSKFAESIRQGTDELISVYGFSDVSAKRIADAGEALALEVEECRIPPEAVIELNVGRDSAENWKELENLSAGQKATAVLLLLLLDADAPLIIDQPEDDLDNQFIAGHVVPIMRTGKKRRQFIFTSHNPNIPVLGDADQIIGLTPTVEDAADRTKIFESDCGSIDKNSVQQLIKDVLEGGDQAFAVRRKKYGF